jgi:hypothetical protein
MAVAVIGNAQNTVDGTDGAAHTSTDDAADSAAHGTGDPVPLVRTFLGATHDALAMTGLRDASHCKNDGSPREEQANG